MRTGCSPAHRAPRFELSTLTRATPKSTKVTNPGSIAWRHTMSTTTKESKSVPGSCPDPMTLLFAFGICTHAKGLRSCQSIRTELLAWHLQLVILHPIVCTQAARITSRSSGIWRRLRIVCTTSSWWTKKTCSAGKKRSNSATWRHDSARREERREKVKERARKGRRSEVLPISRKCHSRK